MALPIHLPVRGRAPARTSGLCNRIAPRRVPRRGVHLRLVGAPAGGSAPGLTTNALRDPSRGNGAERGGPAAGTVRSAVDGARPSPGGRFRGDATDAGPGRV